MTTSENKTVLPHSMQFSSHFPFTNHHIHMCMMYSKHTALVLTVVIWLLSPLTHCNKRSHITLPSPSSSPPSFPSGHPHHSPLSLSLLLPSLLPPGHPHHSHTVIEVPHLHTALTGSSKHTSIPWTPTNVKYGLLQVKEQSGKDNMTHKHTPTQLLNVEGQSSTDFMQTHTRTHAHTHTHTRTHAHTYVCAHTHTCWEVKLRRGFPLS